MPQMDVGLAEGVRECFGKLCVEFGLQRGHGSPPSPIDDRRIEDGLS